MEQPPLPVGFLTDRQGVPSSMRVIALACVAAALLFGGVAVWLDASGRPGGDRALEMAGMLLVGGLSGKVAQAFAGS